LRNYSLTLILLLCPFFNGGRLHKKMEADFIPHKIMYVRYFKGVWIPREIYLDDELNPVQKILLSEINSLDNGEGCFVSNEYLANFLKIDEGSVVNLLTDLRKKDWIINRKFGGCKRYMSINPQKIKINKPRRDLEIISLYIKEIELKPENKEQFNQIVKRNLRASQGLIGYSNEDIKKTIQMLKNTDYLERFTLETVGKFIDSVVAEKIKEGPKILKWERVKDEKGIIRMKPIYEKE